MSIKPLYRATFVAAALLAGFTGWATSSLAASTGTCTPIGFLPVTIAVQGNYCLLSNRVTAFVSGNAITVATSNVTIDLNGHKLGNLAAGPTSEAVGIFALDKQNITIRNGTIRGFGRGISLGEAAPGASSGHLVENMLMEQNVSIGVALAGSGNVVRNNRVVKTGPGIAIPAPTAGGAPTNINNHTLGILLQGGSNTLVANNIVNGTVSNSHAAGILLNGSSLIEIRENTILDTGGMAQTRIGIEVDGGADVTLIGNRVHNASAP